MKVLLTGSTGFIGGAVLAHCLADPAISSVLTLTRRPLPPFLSSHPKLTSLVHRDFKTYDGPDDDDDLLQLQQQLGDVDACLWALGKVVQEPHAAPHEVDIAYPLACAEALVRATAARVRSTGRPLRFVRVSGVLAERDPHRRLWFAGQSRRSWGEAETAMLEFATAARAAEEEEEEEEEKKQQVAFQALVVRPALVLSRQTWGAGLWHALLSSFTVDVDELAAAMVELAVGGGRGGSKSGDAAAGVMVENAELRAIGANALLARETGRA